MSTRKEHLRSLRRPDSFQVKMYNLLNQLVTYRKTFLLTSIAVLGLIIVGAGWKWYQDHARTLLQDQLGTVDLVFAAESEKVEKARDEIQAKIDALTPKKDDKIKTESKPTAAQEALQKEMDAIKPDHTASIEQYLAFYNAHKDKPEGWTAALRVVRHYLDQDEKKLKEATPLLADIVQKATTEKFDQLYVRMLYVSVLEAQGETDKALEEVNKAIPIATEALLPEALLVKSRLLHTQNKKEEAFQALDLLLDKHGTAPEAQKARALKVLWK
jgi:hypothetical protein